jgi:hypothetical protein
MASAKVPPLVSRATCGFHVLPAVENVLLCALSNKKASRQGDIPSCTPCRYHRFHFPLRASRTLSSVLVPA